MQFKIYTINDGTGRIQAARFAIGCVFKKDRCKMHAAWQARIYTDTNHMSGPAAVALSRFGSYRVSEWSEFPQNNTGLEVSLMHPIAQGQIEQRIGDIGMNGLCDVLNRMANVFAQIWQKVPGILRTS
eukprot:6477242-Amphidinium_carterae.1